MERPILENVTPEDPNITYIVIGVENGQSFLLHGPGGTGKSYMLRSIASELVRNGKKVACTAATGVAAVNLSVPEVLLSGSTIHSWAGIGLADGSVNKLIAKVTHDERARKRWTETDLLIIDEISMTGAELFDKLDMIGRKIRRVPDKPFGGIQLILSGDFLQLPPVNDKWAFQSTAWAELEANLVNMILEEPKRYEDVAWFDMLLRLRKGRHTKDDIKVLRTKQVAYEEWLKSVETKKATLFVKPTVLNSKRVDVDLENDQELEKLGGPTKDFIAYDEFQPRNSHARAEHYMKKLDDAIPKYIYLKVGAQVMLKANLDIEGGLANGSRGVVVEIMETGVKVKWNNGKTTLVSKFTWMQEDRDGKAARSQIPLILAWSLTIHKVQGCTLDSVVCNLGPSIFCDGQAYVALSRVRSLSGLYLSEFYPPIIKTNKEALEFVETIENIQPPDEIAEESNQQESPEKEEKDDPVPEYSEDGPSDQEGVEGEVHPEDIEDGYVAEQSLEDGDSDDSIKEYIPYELNFIDMK